MAFLVVYRPSREFSSGINAGVSMSCMLALLAFAVSTFICLRSNSVSTGASLAGGAMVLIDGDMNLDDGFFFIVKFNL